jgi:geranylgeranyl pyrophosphate synthase
MKITSNEIESFLLKELNSLLPDHEINNVYKYALFPTGKLLRSQFLINIFNDLKPNVSSIEKMNLLLGCAFLEFHHAYSLVHDDLPCMDDDTERRGKPTTHMAFGEWKALLVGDGLINASYASLSKMKNSHLKSIFRFATWATGPKGLIQGQVLDLSHEMNQDLKQLIRTHELKTARLFQISAILAYYISIDRQESSIKNIKVLMNLGKNLGITFQLLDDLADLTGDISLHENDINPFLVRREEALSLVTNHFKNLTQTFVKFPQTKIFLEEKMIFPFKELLFANKDKFTKLGIDLEVIFTS